MYADPRATPHLVALEGRLGVPVDRDGNARRLPVSPPLDRPGTLRLTSVELPLSFFQFAGTRGNTSLVVGADPNTGAGGTLYAVPDGNYTASTLVAALNALSIPNLTFALVTAYPNARGTDLSGAVPRVRITNAAGADQTVLWTVDSVHPLPGNRQGGTGAAALQRDLPASQLGWALGFRAPLYVVPAAVLGVPGAVFAEAGLCAQPLRSALVRLRAPLPRCGALHTSAQAGAVIAKILLPPSAVFGEGQTTASVQRWGATLVATCENGLLQSQACDVRDAGSVDWIELEVLDEFGRTLDLQGDSLGATALVGGRAA